MAKHIFAITALMLMYQYATAITAETVTIGNPGNPADTRYADFVHPGGFGSVTKSFRIGQTEITNAQYVEFLNSVAASDPFGLYPNADFSTWSGILQNGSPGTYTYTVKPDAIGQGPDGGNYSYA